MIFIGIDQSINSTGICVIKDNEEYFYIIKHGKLSKKEQIAHDSISNLNYILYEHYDLSLFTNNSDKEIAKTYNILNIVKEIDNIINSFEGDKFICMEGLSYGSQRTNALCDLSGLNFLIRQKFLGPNLYIATPSEVKKFATNNGNCNKQIMIDLFLSTHTNFDIVPKCDDIADAYYLAQLIKRQLKQL